MQYKFMEDTNFEDFSCGRVIYHKAGFPNYPVRLAGEIFMRCLDIMGVTDEKVCIYDPCCGGGYLLTVLGFLYGGRIHSLYGSDISPDAVGLANDNLNLLTFEGLQERKSQLETIYHTYGKSSHLQAMKSIEHLLPLIRETLDYHAFHCDILNSNDTLKSTLPPVDLVITDVPYGNLVSWSNNEIFAIHKMLDNLMDCLHPNALAAISSDKHQKINHPHYTRVEKFQIGKRKVEILRLA